LSNKANKQGWLWLFPLSVLVLCLVLPVQVAAEQPVQVQATVKPLLEVDGYIFKDLNANGQLDPYEDWRLSPEERAEDLLQQMTLKEKIAQMQHPTFVPRPDGSAPSFLEKWAQELNVGYVLVRDLPDGKTAAKTMNQLQSWCEASRLGIPILVSMDSVHGTSYVGGALVHPHNLGLAATRDVDLVRRLTEATREEHLAIGVRMTLSPVADIGTEPRWGRVMETFGEDPDLVAEMVKTQVLAFQNGPELNSRSVLTTVKHFPGSGPQMDGVDMAPIVASKETMYRHHLKPFIAAIEAGTGSVMPYYSIPLALDMMAALGSKVALQEVLRGELGFEGIITTDWGMIWGIQQSATFVGGEISHDEAIVIGVAEGQVDGIGGESIRLIDDMARLVDEGLIDEEIIDRAVRRTLVAKFKMGIFDNPYVDVEYAEQLVGCPEHQALSLEAARKSMTLLKNTGILPLKSPKKVLVAGLRAADMDSLTGGWTSQQSGVTILEEIKSRVEVQGGTVFYEGDNADAAAEMAKECDLAIVVVGEPAYMHSPPWGANTLEITPSQQEMLEAIAETGTPIVVIVLMGRPYILTWCAENVDAILVAYYPGTQGAVAIADVLFGIYNPTGKLPVQIPRSMEQVRRQKSDEPFDIEDPLYDFGFGLSY
jgi:beta-glucosidase